MVSACITHAFREGWTKLKTAAHNAFVLAIDPDTFMAMALVHETLRLWKIRATVRASDTWEAFRTSTFLDYFLEYQYSMATAIITTAIDAWAFTNHKSCQFHLIAYVVSLINAVFTIALGGPNPNNRVSMRNLVALVICVVASIAFVAALFLDILRDKAQHDRDRESLVNATSAMNN